MDCLISTNVLEQNFSLSKAKPETRMKNIPEVVLGQKWFQIQLTFFEVISVF